MRLFVFALLCFFLSLPAHASNKTYSEDETKAEKVIKLHSELMVISLTCRQSSTGRDLVPAYTGFTKRYINQIRWAEDTMAAHFASVHGGNGLTQLDKLRTKLANDASAEVAKISAPTFCANKRDLVITMYDSPPSSVMDESMRLYGVAMVSNFKRSK